MEFLMTYGWAILVVLSAIGALAYFGVLSPDRFLPDRCTAAPPFSCAQYKVIGSNGAVSLWIQANGGTDMSAVSVNLTCADGATYASLGGNTVLTGAGAALSNGLNGLANFTCATAGKGNVVSGTKWKGTYTITYTKAGETVSHTSTGTIQVRAE